MQRTPGKFRNQPLHDIFSYFDGKLTENQQVTSFRKYFKKYIGLENRYTKSNICDFFDFPHANNNFSKEYTSRDALSGFTYYIAKQYFKLKQGVELEFIVEKNGDLKTYHFFDPQLKILVGKISIKKNSSFRGKTYKVVVSATDEDLIGKGYGTKMYLTIIQKVDYLLSDQTLFTGAYRMWKHILPKYVNVWGFELKSNNYNELEKKYVQINPQKKQSVKNFDYFFASTKKNIK